jgi:hypothetical protein
VVASESNKRKKFVKYINYKKLRRKKKKGEEYIPEHGGEEKELRREEKEMDIDVFYIWGRRRRRNEPRLL